MLKAGPERYACVEASRFDWNDPEETLLPWVEAGGRLVVFLDYPISGEDLVSFLAVLGIRAEAYGDEAAPETADDGAALPLFDRRFVFFPAGDGTNSLRTNSLRPVRTVEDGVGAVRLVTVYPGKGSVTLTGRPLFMQNYFLGAVPNARLSWELTGGALEEGGGILFIRERKMARHFFGRLAERGNPLPLAVSVLVLTAVGFWMVIPAFGNPLRDEERPFRPIRDRFLAEIRFLKKYGALDSYLRPYVDNLKKRGRWEGTGELAGLEEILAAGKKLSLKKTMLYLKKLEDMAAHV
jgi:hypothetical protein